MDRRQFLRHATTVATGSTLAASAGCLELLGLTNRGPAGLGGGPTFQDVHRDDADTIVESAGALVDDINQGDDHIIWIPNGVTIDLSGRNLTLRNTTIASGRSDKSAGALAEKQAPQTAEQVFAEATSYADDHDVILRIVTKSEMPASQISTYVATHDISRIGIGSQSQSFLSRILRGSLPEAVMRESSVSVTIIEATDDEFTTRVGSVGQKQPLKISRRIH